MNKEMYTPMPNMFITYAIKACCFIYSEKAVRRMLADYGGKDLWKGEF